MLSFIADAKEQISHLTDEISLKAQDNLEQQVSVYETWKPTVWGVER